jgi:hypothetical protein
MITKETLIKLESLSKEAKRPGETFHAGAEFSALLREHADELIEAAARYVDLCE